MRLAGDPSPGAGDVLVVFREDFVVCRFGEHADRGAHLHITWLGAVLILVFFSALFAYRVVTARLVKRDGASN